MSQFRDTSKGDKFPELSPLLGLTGNSGNSEMAPVHLLLDKMTSNTYKCTHTKCPSLSLCMEWRDTDVIL